MFSSLSYAMVMVLLGARVQAAPVEIQNGAEVQHGVESGNVTTASTKYDRVSFRVLPDHP